MLAVKNRLVIISLWALLGVSVIFWFLAVTAGKLTRLSLMPPFLHLGLSFWLGFVISLIIFFAGTRNQKILSLIVICAYTIMTLSFIFELPAMHDSILNTTALPTAQGQYFLYGKTYPGMRLVLEDLVFFFGPNPWFIAQIFPIIVGLSYLLILGIFCHNWRDILFSSFTSEILFIFFFIVFGESFYLRTNASPQTLGFLFFLLAMSFIPQARKSIYGNVVLFLALLMMIITHPISPLLSLPGFFAAVFIRDENEKKHLLRAMGFVFLVLSGYVLWTLYMGDWVISSALKLILSSLQAEKIQSNISSSGALPQLAGYLLTHRVLLVSLLIVLGLFFLVTRKRRPWRFAAMWGFGLLPAFLLLLNYQDFFDRVLLFGLVPSALLFSEGSHWLLSTVHRAKYAFAPSLILLALMSASVSYFYIGAVDRVTYDELLANHYLEKLGRELDVYANGFNIPSETRINYLPDTRGILDIEKAFSADAIVLNQQSVNAAMINTRAEIQVDEFEKLIQKHFLQIATFGSSRIYLRPDLYNDIFNGLSGE